MAKGCPYGSHRVVEPAGVLPQAAWRLDNRLELWDNEIRLQVDTLNVDAASFAQLRRASDDDAQRVGAAILEIVATRGKLHNPVTGSGGVLIGRVAAVGPALRGQVDLHPGDEVVTLVSLTLTPLRLDEVTAVHLAADQVQVRGDAILFARSLWARLPRDLPRQLVLSALDVCGAPAQTARLAQPGQTVLILGGGGKSGLLCTYEARRRVGATGRVIVLEASDRALARSHRLGMADEYLHVDATAPLAVQAAVADITNGQMADLTLSCVNVPGVEMGAILATRPDGAIYFFSTATSFTAAALGAEGVGSPVQLLIGNGYTPGHAEWTMAMLRESPALRGLLTEIAGSA